MKKQLSTQFGQSSLLLKSATDVDVENLLIKKQHSISMQSFNYKELVGNDLDLDEDQEIGGSTTVVFE